MGQVSCGSCGATFDLTPELPAVFSCGGCGAEVRRPARPVRPAAAAGAARRAGARPGHAGPSHHYRDAANEPAPKGRALRYSIIGVGVAVVAGGIWFLFGTSKEKATETPAITTPTSAGTGTSSSRPVTASTATTPDETQAVAEAPKPAPAPEPQLDETGSQEMVRFKRAAWRAKTAKEHFDAAQVGKAQLDAIKKSAPESPEIAELQKGIQTELAKAIVTDADFAPARAELGHVRYAKSTVSGWAKSDRVPTKLAASLEEAIAALETERDAEKSRRGLAEAPDTIWLSGPLAERWGPVLSEGELLFEDRGSSKTSWFYDKAKKLALRIEGELGVYLSDAKDQDAFDPVIFRPYLIMVQKEKNVKSVDRAYEIVQLVRTLEETWRRRYAKEIDFSGSLSAPPIIILKGRADYKKYEQRHEIVPVVSAGHYEPADRRMFIYKSTPDEERVVIFHEGTHMLIDHKNSVKDGATQAQQSMWFSEGIAEYFGGHGPTGEKDPVTGSTVWEPGRINDTRITAMEMARAMKQLIKFDVLVKTTRSEWAARNVKERMWSQMIYAQGWALVYFLNHGDGGKYQKDFVEYMKLELAGKSGMEAFTQCFGKHGMENLEKGYNDFLDLIIQKHKQNKIVGGKLVD